MSYTPPQVLFGAAYYHEYQPTPRLEQDFTEMKAAGFSVIRIGESVWSTWEPSDNEFDLEWITPVLDAAAAHGISVILGTPTYAIPPWLQRRYPELNVEIATGKPFGWGMRQEIDVSHAAFRFHVERVVRKILSRHASHPAIVGFQVDNEPGAWIIHNHDAFERFRDHLRIKYGTVEALNEAWGLTYWSHRLSDWSDLWRPDANSLPQYDLAWRLFQGDLLTEYMAWQTAIVDEYAGDRFVMTCMSYTRPTVRDDAIGAMMTVTAGNPYFKAQDSLALPSTDVRPQTWWTDGTWGLYHSADWMYGTRHEPFLVTEVGAGSIGFSSMNQPAYPGQRRQSAWALISRGAQMIEYWHWHTLHFGPETYWGGVLPHSEKPGRTYREIAAIGSELAELGDRIVGLTPDAQVGLLFDHASKWIFEGWGSGPLAGPGGMPIPDSYSPIVESFERGAFDAGLQTRLFHSSALLSFDPAEVAAAQPVFIAAAYYVASDEILAWLQAYAEAGGHLIVGPRTGYADPEGRARLEVAPGGGLAGAAGAWYDEYTNLDAPVAVVSTNPDFTLPDAAAATHWIESYEADGADVLATYEHPFHGSYAAVTSRVVGSGVAGSGRITTVGSVPNPEFSAAVFTWAASLLPRTVARWSPDEPSVRVHSAVNAAGERLHVVQNWSWDAASVPLPFAAEDLHSGAALAAGSAVELGAWDVRVVVTRAES